MKKYKQINVHLGDWHENQVLDQAWNQLRGQLADRLWAQLRDQLRYNLGYQLGYELEGRLGYRMRMRKVIDYEKV